MIKLLRFLPWWLVIVGLLFGIAWQFRTNLVEVLISNLAFTSEVSNLQYQIDEINFSNAYVPELNFDIELSGKKISVVARDLRAQYAMDQLQGGTISTLDLESLEIFAVPGDDSISQPIRLSEIMIILANIPSIDIPIQHVDIDQLWVNYAGLDITKKSPIKFSFDNSTDTTNVELTQSGYLLNLSLANRLYSAVMKDQSSTALLRSDISLSKPDANEIPDFSGSLYANLDTLMEIWRSWSNSTIPFTNGEINLEIFATKSPDHWNVEIQGSSKKITSDSFDILDSQIQIFSNIADSIEADKFLMEINPGSEITFSQFNSNAIEINEFIHRPEGRVEYSQSGIQYDLQQSGFFWI